jgi:hypothetical protein
MVRDSTANVIQLTNGLLHVLEIKTTCLYDYKYTTKWKDRNVDFWQLAEHLQARVQSEASLGLT